MSSRSSRSPRWIGGSIRAARRWRVLQVVLALATFGCASTDLHDSHARLDPTWARHMGSGLDALDLGDPGAAARSFERAVRVARANGLPPDELAFGLYHLGDALWRSCGGSAPSRRQRARHLLEEARLRFGEAYGPEHPVLLPVYERIAVLREESGDGAAAASARAAADRIAARSFPRHHFLRERFESARPAALVHPLHVLQLLEQREQSPGETGDASESSVALR